MRYDSMRPAMIGVLVLGFVVALAACGDTTAVVTTEFRAELSGAEEVPPVQTAATGVATFTRTGDVVDYRLEVFDIQNVFAAHIHSGGPGVNGPIVVTLFAAEPPVAAPQGLLAEGSFTVGDVEEITFAALLELMRTGQAYVNVHTTANEEGEMRGQVVLEL